MQVDQLQDVSKFIFFPGKKQYISPFLVILVGVRGGSNSQSLGRQSSVLPLSQILLLIPSWEGVSLLFSDALGLKLPIRRRGIQIVSFY